jgi:hypothetical protein
VKIPPISQVSRSTPFDNETNGFVSENAQEAIEESRDSCVIEEVFSRSGNVVGGTWLLLGSNPSNKVGWSVKINSSSVVRVDVGSEDQATYSFGVYIHDGDEVNLTQLGVVNVVSSSVSGFSVNYQFTGPKQVAIRIESGSVKNPNIECRVRGLIGV